jgi:serine/threonine-protein kinase ULK/ATG1
VKHILGRGSFGTVYKGRNTESEEVVALKVVPQGSGSVVEKEVSIMKRFNHENIVKLFDVLDTVNNKYIVSEFCDGPDLRQYLQQTGPLNEGDALKVLEDIVQGLKEIVSHGIIHRDLKPANVIRSGSTFKITDFGFSRSCDNTQMM